MGGNSAGSGVRSALIIAADNYEDPGLSQLASPSRDAEELANVLADPQIGGYRIRPLVNTPAHVAREAIEEFFTDARRDDKLLLYLSCHGVKDQDGRLCFAVATTKLRLLASTGIPADFVYEQVDRCRSRHIVLLLDCCYSGAYTAGHRPRSPGRISLGPLESDSPRGEGWAVITSCTDMEYAFEIRPDDITARTVKKAQPSIFTDAVVHGLRTGEADRDGDGMVSVDDLYDFVWDRVRERTPHQSPTKIGASRGNLVIAQNPQIPVPAGREPVAAVRSRHPRRRRTGLIAAASAVLLASLGAGIWLSQDQATASVGLTGGWLGTYTVISSSNYGPNLVKGAKLIVNGWRFVPSCAVGPCPVTLYGNIGNVPFTARLADMKGVYTGSTSVSNIGVCIIDNRIYPDKDQLRFRITVGRAAAPGPGVTASPWSGVMAVSTSAGACASGMFTASFSSASPTASFSSAGPVVRSVSPGTASAGQLITVSGVNFGASQGTSYVVFGDENIGWGAPLDQATFRIDSWSDNSITFTVPTPSGSGGTWHVSPGTTATIMVMTADGGISNGAKLTVGSG
jgi:hypothetical protein